MSAFNETWKCKACSELAGSLLHFQCLMHGRWLRSSPAQDWLPAVGGRWNRNTWGISDCWAAAGGDFPPSSTWLVICWHKKPSTGWDQHSFSDQHFTSGRVRFQTGSTSRCLLTHTRFRQIPIWILSSDTTAQTVKTSALRVDQCNGVNMFVKACSRTLTSMYVPNFVIHGPLTFSGWDLILACLLLPLSHEASVCCWQTHMCHNSSIPSFPYGALTDLPLSSLCSFQMYLYWRNTDNYNCISDDLL